MMRLRDESFGPVKVKYSPLKDVVILYVKGKTVDYAHCDDPVRMAAFMGHVEGLRSWGNPAQWYAHE